MAGKTVYLVQRLLDDNYEVIAITSTEQKGKEAVKHHFKKTFPNEKICSYEQTINRIRKTGENIEMTHMFLETTKELEDGSYGVNYLIVPCEIDNPYWFGKEET